ncbi:glutaredoxin family protein [Pseudalkalibacillus decolorationis]|uniref:glutaredoxin family protein n=1 Tax=Pseudalkalibacillus decolorationis TaxID=163879 RepID=UPI0021487F6F|nr:glutaredoxin family protein [Pseudalkalibacillus decolorationis]
MKPVLYTIDGCVNCNKAKQHLIENNIPFIEKNLFTDSRAALEVKELIGEVVTPVFINGPVIVKGSDILMIEKKGDNHE